MVSSSSVFGGWRWWCDGGSFQKGVRVRNCFLLGLIWPPGPICTWCEQDLLKCQVHITLMVAMIYELAIRESPIFSSIHLNQVQYTSSSNISWAVIIIFKKLGKLIVLVLEHILSCAIIQWYLNYRIKRGIVLIQHFVVRELYLMSFRSSAKMHLLTSLQLSSKYT